MSAIRLETRASLFPFGAVLFCTLLLPDVRYGQESGLVTHMLVQVPLLAFSGWCMGAGLMSMIPELGRTDWNKGGVPGLIVAVIALLFWMLPKSLDGALDSSSLELAKFITLPLCMGLPIALSWPRAHVLLCGLLKAQLISMLGVLSFLYVNAPVRICNNYLLGEQVAAGLVLGAVAAALALWWGGRLFFEPGSPHSSSVRRRQEAFAGG